MNEKRVLIPWQDISDQALSGLIEEFILREGTDYGNREFSFEEKHAQIKRQLTSGDATVVFDIEEDSASIVKRDMLR